MADQTTKKAADKPFRARLNPEGTKQTHTISGMQVFKRGNIYSIDAKQKAILDKQYNRHGAPESGYVFQTGTAEEFEEYDLRKRRQAGAPVGSIAKPIAVKSADDEKPAPNPNSITTADFAGAPAHKGGGRGKR